MKYHLKTHGVNEGSKNLVPKESSLARFLKKRNILKELSDGKYLNNDIKQEAGAHAQAAMVAGSGVPANWVDNKYFIAFCATMDPKFRHRSEMPSLNELASLQRVGVVG